MQQEERSGCRKVTWDKTLWHAGGENIFLKTRKSAAFSWVSLVHVGPFLSFESKSWTNGRTEGQTYSLERPFQPGRKLFSNLDVKIWSLFEIYHHQPVGRLPRRGRRSWDPNPEKYVLEHFIDNIPGNQGHWIDKPENSQWIWQLTSNYPKQKNCPWKKPSDPSKPSSITKATQTAKKRNTSQH